jgi:hypothetical protein
VQVAGQEFPPGDTVEILYGPPGTGGCANRAATATVDPDGTFTATFSAPDVARNDSLVLLAVDPASSGGTDYTRLQAQVTFVVNVAELAPTAFSAVNPLNLPAPLLQVLFAFATLSGIASLIRFLWDFLRGTFVVGAKVVHRMQLRKT